MRVTTFLWLVWSAAGFLVGLSSVHAADITVQGSVDLTPGFNLLGLPVDPTTVPDTGVLLPQIGTPT